MPPYQKEKEKKKEFSYIEITARGAVRGNARCAARVARVLVVQVYWGSNLDWTAEEFLF